MFSEFLWRRETQMSEPSRKPLVLVADDDRDFREKIIPEALQRLNAHVEPAEDVLGACLVVAEHGHRSDDPLDLIVLDMDMPLHKGTAQPSEVGGIRFLRSYGLVKCPVVVFTQYPSCRNCVEAVQAGAVAYLPKGEVEDRHGHWEGGVDDLVETCRRLLRRDEAAEIRHPASDDWLDQNYDWLCREFGGRWIACVPASKAQAADITGIERQGLVVVCRDTREELARLLIRSVPLLGEIPQTMRLPQKQ